MLTEILRFEFDYRKRRAATYIYFVLLFVFSFAAVTSPYVSLGGVSGGQIKENSPFNLAHMTIVMTLIMTFIASAIMGVAVLRDFDHKMEALVFSKPISKFNYLLGRFLGSFAVMVLIYCSIWMAFMLGFSIGKYLPWDSSWKEKEMLPFQAWSYFQPFILYGITNLFIQGAIFFAAGALSRKSIVLYTQGIVLLVLYEVTDTMLADMENKNLAALLDPFAIRAFTIYTQYWSPVQKNSMLVPLEGVLLWNRLIWCGAAMGILVITYFGFSFNVVRSGFRKKKALEGDLHTVRIEIGAIPLVSQHLNTAASLRQLWHQALFYSKVVVKEVPFIAIVLIGLIDLIVSSFYFSASYGTSSYPITANVLSLLNDFDLFFLIIIVFYSGELIWKERSINVNLIKDAMPVRDWVNVVAKFLSMCFIYVGLLLVLIICGVLIQASKGYFNFELSLYFKSLFVNTLFFLIAWTLLSFFIQIITNNKFVGYALMFVFFLVIFFIGAMGVQHPMLIFNSGSLRDYSDMNKYGHFVTAFVWLKLYWLLFVGLLFAMAVLFAVRGTEALFETRLKLAKLRLKPALLTLIITSLIAFSATGWFVYSNTNKLNTYLSRDQEEDQQAEYEKALKKFENLPQPRIVAVNMKVDIYPERRDFVAEGYYWLKNKTLQPITDVHIQNNFADHIQLAYLKFNVGASKKKSIERFGYTIYALNKALQPGDSLKMSFKSVLETKGFTGKNSQTKVVYNGTFFDHNYFPSLGYNDSYEIKNDDTRRKKKLPKKEGKREQNDPVGLSQSLFGDDSDYIRFELVLGTSKDQIAIAPGYLEKEWEENNRRYFHYKMDVPMVNFYSIVSARYQVMKDKWKDVDLEIYHHKGHEYNLKRMMGTMKASLAYCSKNFSPFQFRQMRIMEFPRYANFAQAFANTVPFSEALGFIQRIDDPKKDLDMPYYVTAHEVAHQWWGHQVPEANVKGSSMISETLAQYSALMVMKQTYSPEMMQKFLKYELDVYLKGRSDELKKEQPLVNVDDQGYIHYNKGSLVMFALQDYIGEQDVNQALQNFLGDWQYPAPDVRQRRYPTSRDLLGYFKAKTPDSLKYIITDMFETITLFENKAQKVAYYKKPNEGYEVTIAFTAEKFRADSSGNDNGVRMNDWMDVGVYAKTSEGKDKLIYLKKHKISKKENTLKIMVSEKPSRAGIDPLNKLIDRHPDDNVKTAD